eukprot:6772353-Alexandrium_andersonii.AAC.1
MEKFHLNEDDVRSLIEIEKNPKVKFLMAWDQGKLYVKAAHGHSKGVSDRINVAEALDVIKLGDPGWVKISLHGTKETN